MTIQGFQSLELIASDRSNPLSKNRDGLTIGEGGALFLMTREPGGIQLRGVGESSDAHHISAPEPHGSGAVAAMRRALEDAGATARQVAYVNLHGTGTTLNDSMEALAISTVLGSEVPCSSTKPLTGHLLGASGACEAALCWLALSHPTNRIPLPPHHWDTEHDPTLAPILVVQPGQTIEVTAEHLFLSNSFAFGGNNCCIAIGLGSND